MILDNVKVKLYTDIKQKDWYVDNNELIIDLDYIVISKRLPLLCRSSEVLRAGVLQNTLVADNYQLPYNPPTKKMTLDDIKKELGYNFELIDL